MSGRPRYPVIAVLVRWGDWLAIGLSLLPLAAAMFLVAAGQSWLVLLAAAVSGIVIFGFVKSYVELIRIIDDNLLPK